MFNSFPPAGTCRTIRCGATVERLRPPGTNAGRSPKADIFLDDVTVSRKHCQFIASEGGHIVRDSGSLNGTYVNRERVDSIQLHAGDEVQIGKYRLTYQPSTKQA